MPFTKKEENIENVIIELYGFKIKANTLYEIKEKLDTSAPDGFKEYNTSKVLSDTIVDTFPGAIFDKERSIWDTGLYPTSSSFMRAVPEPVRASALKLLTKHIVEPIENEKGKGVLDHTSANNAFWDNYRIELGRGKLYDTSKITDLLKLFLLLIHRRVTPKEMESHPDFKQPISMYCIVDKDSSVSIEAEKSMRTAKANALFYNLLNTNKESLLQVLEYIGINASKGSDTSVLYTVFTNYINSKEDKFQNDKIFIEAVEKQETEDGEEEIYIHSKLKEFYLTGKVKNKKGDIYIDDIYAGNNFKNAATAVKNNPELKKAFASLVE